MNSIPFNLGIAALAVSGFLISNLPNFKQSTTAANPPVLNQTLLTTRTNRQEAIRPEDSRLVQLEKRCKESLANLLFEPLFSTDLGQETPECIQYERAGGQIGNPAQSTNSQASQQTAVSYNPRSGASRPAPALRNGDSYYRPQTYSPPSNRPHSNRSNWDRSQSASSRRWGSYPCPPRYGHGRSGEWRNSDGRYGDRWYGDGRYDDGRYTDGWYGDGRYDDGRYTDGRYGDGWYDDGWSDDGWSDNWNYNNPAPRQTSPTRQRGGSYQATGYRAPQQWQTLQSTFQSSGRR